MIENTEVYRAVDFGTGIFNIQVAFLMTSASEKLRVPLSAFEDVPLFENCMCPRPRSFSSSSLCKT